MLVEHPLEITCNQMESLDILYKNLKFMERTNLNVINAIT